MWGKFGWPINSTLPKNGVLIFERGAMYESSGLSLDQIVGCPADTQRDDDSKHGAPQAIIDLFHQKEDATFSNFDRVDGTNGEIHPYCGGWIVDYSSVRYKDGREVGKTWMMTNSAQDAVYVMDGRIANKYWTHGGCERFGVTTSDRVVSETQKYRIDIINSTNQSFANGVIYDYQNKCRTGCDNSWKTYYILDRQIENIYNEAIHGMPVTDTMVNGMGQCVNGITYQVFEFKQVSKVDDVRSMTLDGYRFCQYR